MDRADLHTFVQDLGMLPAKFYKHFGIRVKLTQFAMATYFQWNSEKDQLVLASQYFIYGMHTSLYFGIWLLYLHCIHLYMKISFNDIPEENEFEEDEEKNSSFLRDFPTLLIQGGYILLITCCTFLTHIFLKRKEVFTQLLNELFNYNKKLSVLIKCGELLLTGHQKRIVRLTTVLLYSVMIISLFLPIGLVMTISNTIEPHHQIIEEWLEIPVQFNWTITPIIVLWTLNAYSVGTTICLMCFVICLYCTTTTVCTEAFTPEQMFLQLKEDPGRSTIRTIGFGLKSDSEVIQLYRTQQIFNMLISSFFRSVFVSFHHVGLLGTFVSLFVFAIKYGEILGEAGLVAYIIVFSSMVAPIILIYFQCKMGGAVVDISKDFKFSGQKLFPTRTAFRKFAKSCTTFYNEVTYPFYKIHGETFAMFGGQAIDWSMDLLLGHGQLASLHIANM